MLYYKKDSVRIGYCAKQESKIVLKDLPKGDGSHR